MNIENIGKISFKILMLGCPVMCYHEYKDFVCYCLVIVNTYPDKNGRLGEVAS